MGGPSAKINVTAFSSLPKPNPGADTSLATMASQPFSRSLARARDSSSAGALAISAANPTR